jgi:hypothetical protein
MGPMKLKAWKKNRKLPANLEYKSDSFSFGLSIIEMGNLLTLKNIRLNLESKLLE